MRALSLLACLLLASPALGQECILKGGPVNFPLTVSAAVTGAGAINSVAAVLPGAGGRTTWICGFTMTSAGATAGTVGLGTVTGLANGISTGIINGTLSFAYIDPSSGQGFIGATFAPYCLAAFGQNQAITVTVPGGGTGTLAKSANAWGCQQ